MEKINRTEKLFCRQCGENTEHEGYEEQNEYKDLWWECPKCSRMI